MRMRIQSAFLLVLLFVQTGNGGLWAADQAGEPNKFFHDFIGLTDDQIRAIRDGKAVAKVLESPTPDEVFLVRCISIPLPDATWPWHRTSTPYDGFLVISRSESSAIHRNLRISPDSL